MGNADWQRLGFGVLPRGEDRGSPTESPRMFPAEGGMDFELIRQGVSRPDHNWPGIVG